MNHIFDDFYSCHRALLLVACECLPGYGLTLVNRTPGATERANGPVWVIGNPHSSNAALISSQGCGTDGWSERRGQAI